MSYWIVRKVIFAFLVAVVGNNISYFINITDNLHIPEFESEKVHAGDNKTLWVEYRKMKSFLTVSIFNNESYERETQIERQYTEGWANANELRYLRIFQ